ncbi:30S ribosomal protein S17 [Patescibacteria group bacterium]|nr:30S ribosomal protein S17 [Patescibacteria group bacterium]
MNEEETIEKKKALKRSFEGEVVSVKEDKTIHVLVAKRKMHPKYRKQYTRTKKYPVHDENGVAKLGDKVAFGECRPLSKTKRWRLMRVIK